MSSRLREQELDSVAPSTSTFGMWRARGHETLIYLASHPLAFILAWALRRMGTIAHVPGLGYVVDDASLARQILADQEHFSKSGPGSAGALITQVMGEQALLNTDGEAHRILKGRLVSLFSSAYLDRLVGDALNDSWADLRNRLICSETVDLVRVVQVITGRLMCCMLGIQMDAGREEETCLEIFDLGVRLVSIMRLSTKQLSPKQVERSRQIFEQLTGHARISYDRCDNTPSVLDRLRELGLSFQEARGVIAALLLTGTETVATALPRIVALLVDTELWPALRTRPELLQSAIDEGLRYTSPSPLMLRSVVSDVEIGGRRLRSRERVIIFTYNLLRDPRYIEHPRHFGLGRRYDPAIQHLWFGAGQHFCLGYVLAQRELRGALETLLGLPGDVEIVRRSYARHVLIPGYSRLEVRLQA